MLRTNIIIDKTTIIGVSILEISKTRMYDSHYNFMLRKFHPKDCSIAYTDTDSFVYKLNCEDMYSDLIRENYEHFDTSGFKQPNSYNIEAHNEKVLGVMKDENKGMIMTELRNVGLRSKMYAFKVCHSETIKKAKGVKNSFLSNKIEYDDFIKCLLHDSPFVGKQSTMKTYLHQMFTISTQKVMLYSTAQQKTKLREKCNPRDPPPYDHV